MFCYKWSQQLLKQMIIYKMKKYVYNVLCKISAPNIFNLINVYKMLRI